MAILFSQLSSSGTYSLTSADASNRFYGLANVAETVNLYGSNMTIDDVSNGDRLNLKNLIPTSSDGAGSGGVSIAVAGNNVILTSGTQTYALGALIAGETVTVGFGTGTQAIVISATTSGYSYVNSLVSTTPVTISTSATAISFDTTIATPTITLTHDNGSSQTDKITNDAALTFSNTASDVTRTYSVDGTAAVASYVTPTINGSHTIVVNDVDTAGNTASASLTFTLDNTIPLTIAPVVLAITSPLLTNSTTPLVSGTAETGMVITAVIAGATYGTTATGGAWSVDTTPTTGTAVTSGTLAINPNGDNTISVTAMNLAGNVSSPVVKKLVVDTTAPTVTAFSSSTTDGSYKAGSTINITATTSEAVVSGQTIVATLNTDETVTLTADGTTSLVGAYTVGANKTSADLTVTSFTSTATDMAGNALATAVPTSNNIAAAKDIVVDTTAPSTPVINTVATNDIVNNSEKTNVAVSGTAENGASVAITWAGTTQTATATGGNWTTTFASAPADGSTTISVIATDLAGNVSAAATKTILIDTVLPTANFTAATDDVGSVKGALAPGATTDDTALVLSGTNEIGASVDVYNGTNKLGAATVVGTTWTYTATVENATTYSFNAIETDTAGNVSAATTGFAVTGDTAAPTAIFTAATDDAGSVKGTLTTGGTTDDSSLVLSGTNETGSTVNVYDGTTLLGAATVSGTGWTFDATIANARTYSFNVKETDAAGNTSAATTNFVVTGDNIAPIATATLVTITSPTLTNDTTPVVTGTAEAGSAITVTTDADTVNAKTYTTTATGGTWSITVADLNALTSGSHNIGVTATDTAGNTSSPVTQTLMIDTTAPTLGIASNVSAVKIGETATVTFTFSEDPGSTFTWDGSTGDVVVSGGTLSAINGTGLTRTATFTPTAGLNSGSAASITIAASAYTDLAGNNGGAGTTPTIAIDTLAPNAPTFAENTTKTFDGYLNATEATSTSFKVTLAGSLAVAGDKVEILLNNAAFSTPKIVTLSDADITAGIVNVDILSTDLVPDGSKSLTAKITDIAGNVGAASSALAFTLDTTAPPTAPTTVTLTPVGGNVVANLLNNTNTSLTASATITLGQATGGSAVLKINGTQVATDASIAPNDTTVTFSVSDVTAITTGTATVEITDLAGNTTVSSVSNPTLTVNRTAPALTASVPAISVDNGSSSTDLITNRAVQTITSTLGRSLSSEVLYGSTNGGATWTDITSKVSTAALSWDGAVLAVGSNSIILKVKDSATGNEATVNTAGYTLDTVAPTNAPTFALATDSGAANSDGISTIGDITVTTPSGGFEANARWDYSLDGGQIWSGVQGTGVTSFTLPVGTYAINAIQVRHIDEAGNASTVPTKNAAQIVIDQTPPTASVTAAVVKNGAADKVVVQSTEKGVAYLVKSTLTQPTTYTEVKALETASDTSVNSVAITTANTNTDLLTTSLVDGTYKVYTVDEAGNLSTVSTNSIVVDSTAPIVTVTGATFIQKNLTTENTIRLAGTGFSSLLTSGKEFSGSDINDARFDWTAFDWISTSTTITSADIAEIKVNGDGTALDIVLKPSNALYSNANFLTGGDAVADTLTISAGFFKDAAGNAATETLITAATVDTTTLFKMDLLNGTNAPTIYVPQIELTAPTTKANGVDYDNATFDGTNLKATPTVGLSILGIHTGQTVTVNHLGKMDYTTAAGSNSITFSSAGSATGSISLNLSGVRSIILNNDSTNPANTSVTFMGGGAYTDLGTGSSIDTVQLTTLTPVAAVGNSPIDWVANFTSGTDKVNFKASVFTALTSATNSLKVDVSKIYTDPGDGSTPTGSKNIWIMGDGTIAYDADGTWDTYDAGAMGFTANTNGSVALINISGVAATDLYLV